MIDNLYLNDKKWELTEADLPCLVSYREKSGGSHFSISMIANLFLSGSKILFLTAYPMAKDNILEQLKGYEEDIDYITDISNLNKDKKLIILESGNEELFIKACGLLTDISDRVVLIKNMEVFNEETINKAVFFPKILISGDIDKCKNKENILNIKFENTIIFSKPDASLLFEVPALEKYTGYLYGNLNQGIVSIKNHI